MQSRLGSNETDFEQNKEKMRSWFAKREYPEKLIDSEIRKAKFNTRETNRKNKSKNGVPVVSLLYVDQKVKEVHEHFYSQISILNTSDGKINCY